MRGKVEVPTVPLLGGVVCDVGVVSDQRPAGQVIEDIPLVVMENIDVDVAVIAGLSF